MSLEFDRNVLLHHPCSTLLLDDDADVVETLRNFLGGRTACLGYTSPKLALGRLANTGQSAADLSRFIGHYGDRPEDQSADKADRLLLLRYSEVLRYATSPSRYDMISVVISDYDMPEMTGIDFFRQIKHLKVKKVLLTGKADEKVAVEAFNEDIIDGFLLKQDPRIPDRLPAMVLAQHNAFIRENSRILVEMLRASQDNTFEHDGIDAILDQVRKNFSFMEYYFITEPRGFILRNAAGKTKMLRLETKKTLGEIADIFEDQYGRSPMSDAVRAAAVLPENVGGPGWVHRLYDDFETHLVPCRITGDWAWALTDFSQEEEMLSTSSWSAHRSAVLERPINPRVN